MQYKGKINCTPLVYRVQLHHCKKTFRNPESEITDNKKVNLDVYIHKLQAAKITF